MKTTNWLLCHVHAYQYFGGATRLLIPDNLKTGVSKNTRYETILNKSYAEMAEYYETAIVPARVRAPQDKSLAEGTVKFATTWIIAALRNRKFFSLEEVKSAVKEKLDELNKTPFKKREGCSYSAYKEEEQSFMKPLPLTPFEPAVWSTAKVPLDYLIRHWQTYQLVYQKTASSSFPLPPRFTCFIHTKKPSMTGFWSLKRRLWICLKLSPFSL